MVIIGISNIPPRMNLKQLVVCLAPTIGGQFEALNFKVVQRCRTAYVRLADTIAVKEVIQRINSKKIGPNQVKAFIPDVVPDLPIAYSPKSIPAKLRRKLKIPLNCTPKEIVRNAVLGIMREMQTKFTGLCKLSQDTNHQLLGDIAVMVYRRVKAIVDDPRPYDVNSFKVAKAYRRKYPHGGDFALIVSTLHDIEDAQGRPRSTVKENKLTAVPQKTLFNVPYDEMRKLSNSHITRISQKLVEHVNNLEVTEQTSSPEQAARMKVRRQLKTLVPHLESMVKSVIEKHLLPETDKFCPVKIYGEPMLPFKELMQPFLAQFHPVSTTRAEQVHNLIMLKVPRATYLKLLQANGVTINGVKLIIRPGKVNYYDVTRYLSANTDWASEMPGPAEPEAHAGASGDMDWSDSW